MPLLSAHQRGQLPPKMVPLDEWADTYRYLNVTTGEKWHTDRQEIARGPMKAVTELGVRTITVMCATQLLKTEFILNTIGYFVHLDPCPILIVQPKDEMARKFSHIRLKEMIKSTPVLRKLFFSEKAKDASNTTQHKEFKGGHLDIVSAKSPSNLAMTSIRIVLADEIDKYDESSGKEGDPISLAEERMSKYATNSLSIRVSSPTTKDMSRVEESYLSSDQRKPLVICPHCNHKQVMLWKNVVWEKDDQENGKPETAQYCCEDCGVAWTEYERLKALKNIIWRQTVEWNCPACRHNNKPMQWGWDNNELWDKDGRAICQGCKETKCSNTHAGFWASKLYGAFRALDHMCQLWLECQGNIEKLKMFINTQLAETFEEAGEKIEDTSWLMKRRENYNCELPEEVGILTAGLDTQNNRIEIEVVGWGKDCENWSIDHRIIPGDPSHPDTWALVDQYLNKPFVRNDGRYTYIAAAAIDMGGGNTQHVANYCQNKINRRIWPIRGVGGEGKPIPVWPKNPSRAGKYDVPFYNIGVDAAKNVIFSWLFVEKPGPGYCHFPHDRSEDWFKQLTAEKRKKKYKGTRKILVWDNTGKKRNEAFDMRVYAYAALCGLAAMGWNLNNITEKQKLILISEETRLKLKQALPDSRLPVKSKNDRPIAKSKFMSR